MSIKMTKTCTITQYEYQNMFPFNVNSCLNDDSILYHDEQFMN